MQVILPQESLHVDRQRQKRSSCPRALKLFHTASAAAKFAELRDKRRPPRPVRVNVCNIRRQYGRDALPEFRGFETKHVAR